jgi:hypothetical protein
MYHPFIHSISVIIKIGILPLSSFNAAFIASYIINRFKIGFPWGKYLGLSQKVIYCIFNAYLKGFRILLSGRFSRKIELLYVKI